MAGYSNRTSSKYVYESGDRRRVQDSPYEVSTSYRRRPNRSPYSRSPSPGRRRRRSHSSDDRRHCSPSSNNYHRFARSSRGNIIVMLFLPVTTTENDVSSFFAGCHFGVRSVEFRKNYDDLTVHAFVDLGSVDACKQFLSQTSLGVISLSQCRIKVVTENFYNDQEYMGYHLYETPELPSALRSDSLARHLIDNLPCNVLIFKSLDYSATEDQVRESVTNLTPDPLYDVRVIKDKATGLSRGFCFVEMGTVADATKLLNIVLHKSPPYTIGNRRVLAGYARMSSYNSNGLGSLLPSTVDSFVMDKSNHTSQVANNAIAAAQLAQNTSNSDTTMTYDPHSGFYYDSNSGFYYDPKSGYYYDTKNSTYMYYDQNTSKWITLPTTAATNSAANSLTDNPSFSAANSVTDSGTIVPENEKLNNQSVSEPSALSDPKKIAKEMEKWAKKQKTQKRSKNLNHPSEGVSNALKSRSAFQSVQLDVPKSLSRSNINLDDPFVICDRLLCLLCVRRFKSQRHLQSHVRLSQLHKQSIGVDGQNECFLLDCDGDGILLDFPIVFQTNTAAFTPKIQNNVFDCSKIDYLLPCLNMVDMRSLQTVLVSNVYSMIALPFLTERTEFNGKIYATTPIYELGKLMMKDIVINLHTSKTTIKQSTTRNQLNTPEENIKLGVYVTAISSGHSFGSCNWLIQNNDEKICYLAASSMYKTHAIPLQTQYMNDVDILLVSQLSHCEVVRPDSLIQSTFELIVETIRNGGNVLFPIYPTGFIYDLIQFLSTYLDKENYPQIPIYCISPVISPSLAYSNISAEWLTNERLEVCYSGSVPFEHQTLIDKKRLICVSSLSDLGLKSIRKPCIVLASNPFLMCGASRDLFNEWKNDAENCCIFTDPNYSIELAIDQFDDVTMKCHKVTVDTRLSYLQLANLINEIQPLKVILPTTDFESFKNYLNSSNTEIKISINNVIDFKSNSKFQTLDSTHRQMHETLYIPKEIANHVIIGPFTNNEDSLNPDQSDTCSFLSCFVEEKNGKLIAYESDHIEKPYPSSELSINGILFPIGKDFQLNELIDFLKKTAQHIEPMELDEEQFSCEFKLKNEGYVSMDYTKYPIKFSITENVTSSLFAEFFQHLNDWLASLCVNEQTTEE